MEQFDEGVCLDTVLSIGHTAGMMIYDMRQAALDLALACRRAIDSGSLDGLTVPVMLAEDAINLSAGLRAKERALRTGATANMLEEETQALLVAVLLSDPIAWSPGRVGVVDANHSPQGAAKSRFQAAAMRRAGARAGWPDLDVRLVTPSGPHGVLLELKVGKGRESAEQKARRLRLVAAGYDARLVRGLGEALLAVVNLLSVRYADSDTKQDTNTTEVPF